MLVITIAILVANFSMTLLQSISMWISVAAFWISLLLWVAGVLVIFYRNDIMDFASKTFHVELFPKQFYYFDGLPAHIVATDVLIIVGASIALCTLGALLPALCAARLDPAKALRYE